MRAPSRRNCAVLGHQQHRTDLPTARDFHRPQRWSEPHVWAAPADATATCWGRNFEGQATAPMGTFIGLAAGRYHTCGVHTDATVSCWGSNNWGQATPPTGTFISLTAGWDYTCGLRTDATATCWGINGYGEATAPLGTFISLAAYSDFTCGLRPEGTATCWGSQAARWRLSIARSTTDILRVTAAVSRRHVSFNPARSMSAATVVNAAH